MESIYDQIGKNAENYSDEDIVKAIIAGEGQGHDVLNTLNAGPSLKPESLDPVVKVLENKENTLKVWKMLPKKSIFVTSHDYNQLVSYGQNVGIFMDEGESPEQTDSQYRRKTVMVKYMGIQGELTQQAMLVRAADGKDPYTREVENKTMKLLTQVDGKISSGNKSLVSQEFDGLLKQHFDGVLDITVTTVTDATGAALDTYRNDVTYINANGKALLDSNVEDAVQAIINERYGEANTIIGNPTVFSNYVKRFHESKRVMVNSPEAATTGATMGQKVNYIQSQFEKINIEADIFWDKKVARPYSSFSTATSAKAPNAPTAANDTSVTVGITDTKTHFTGWGGTYHYAVSAINKYGESALTLMNSTPKTVAVTEAVDLLFTATASTYAGTAYRIYRTEKSVANYLTAKFYPIFEISAAELAAGYDGGAAPGKVRDRNRVLPNTTRAMVIAPDSTMFEYIQLASTMKVDFAITTLARRFAIVNYGTPALYMPGKVSIIHNLGSDIS